MKSYYCTGKQLFKRLTLCSTNRMDAGFQGGGQLFKGNIFPPFIPVDHMQTAIAAARQGSVTDIFITPSFLISHEHWITLRQSWK
jgi:hypothetical protein